MDFSVGIEDVKDWKKLIKSLLAEFIGTLMLVLVGCGSALNWKTSFDVTQISLAFGLAVMAMVTVFGPVSGGNLNPGVSVGLLAGGELSLLKCLFYIVVQSLGAIVGAGLLYGVTPANQRDTIGANSLNSTDIGDGRNDEAIGVALHAGAGFVLEALLTMMLVLVVYASAVDPKTKAAPGVAPILIGFTVAAAHLVCITYTGTSINPARSLGSAVFSGVWADHWVFWVGPLVGGALGGFLYNFVFRNKEYAQVSDSDSEKKVDSPE